MPMNWNAEGDFAKVVDTLESITLLSRGGQQEANLNAWKFSEKITEIPGTEGKVLHWDAIWQVPNEDSLYNPIIGSRLLESDNTCWILTSVEELQGKTRLRCEARRVELAVGTADWLEVQHSNWEEVDVEETPTPQVVDWLTEREALRGHIWLNNSEQSGAAGEVLVETYRVALTEPYKLSPHHRVKTQAGVIYSVVAGTEAARLGELWIYGLRRETNAIA